MITVKEDTNLVSLRGEIDNELEFSHEVFGEKFYNARINIARLSEYSDLLPLTISERLLQEINLEGEQIIDITGQLRSYNKNIDGKNKLILTIFAREVKESGVEYRDPNSIFLDGYICKKPIYRKTPLGREITDILIAINRSYNKSDYIPCIVWGRNAKFAKNLNVGDRIQMWGRVQSREYEKKIDEVNVQKRTAYEVSISKIKKLSENNNK